MFKFTILVAILIKYASTENSISEIPGPYHLDDYVECRDQQDIYCHMKIILKPLRNDTKIWQKIQASKDTLTLFSRDILHTGLCVSKDFVNNPEGISKNVTQKLDLQLKKFALRSSVAEIIDCNNGQYKLVTDYFDTIVIVSSVCYLLLIFFATFCDASKSAFLSIFSLKSNWTNFTKLNTSPDYIKSMQGMRTIVMIVVIIGHCLFMYSVAYVENTDYLEYFTQSYLWQVSSGASLQMVQTFFTLSAWLVALQVHKTIERKKSLSAKDLLMGFAMRYVRLMPLLLIMIALSSNAYLAAPLFGGPHAYLFQFHRDACKTNWWTTALFITNYNNNKDQCNPTTWSVSVDTQMLALSLVLLYLIFKFKLSAKMLGVAFLASYLIHAAYLYYYDLGALMRSDNPDMLLAPSYYDPQHTIYKLYISTPTNASCYILGLCFGSFYYHHKNKVLPNYKIFVVLWALILFGTPILTMYLAGQEYTRTSAAFTGPFIKLLLSFAISMSILGMHYNIGGFIKTFLESNFLQYLAKISFSTYVFHYTLASLILFQSNEALYVNKLNLMIAIIIETVLSILLGFIVYMLIELPLENIIKAGFTRFTAKTSKDHKKVQ